MISAKQAREEEHFREVEGAMLHVQDAARFLSDAAESLKKDDANPDLVAALETAADAVRADHARLMQSVYWPAPAQVQGELVGADDDQQRLAS